MIMPQDDVSITLAATEWQFLVTILKGTTAILTALAGLREALPSSFHVPITFDTITNITVLAERIESQAENSE
jgi:hypothetical protein